MPLLPPVEHDFFSEETDTESPVAEQLLQKVGENLNYLNGLLSQFQVFTSNGPFVVPEGVTRGYVLACGGGGGGAGGGRSSNFGGGGGAGAVPKLILLTLTPLETWNVVLGVGGAGGLQGVSGAGGGAGGNTSFLNSVTGYGPIFYGARGGAQGVGGEVGGNGLNYNPVTDRWFESSYFTNGSSGTKNPSGVAYAGQSSQYGIGQTGDAGHPGGGGGAGLGNGGRGGGGTVGPGGDATVGGYGAGGGGGYGAAGGKPGASGGQGILYVFY